MGSSAENIVVKRSVTSGLPQMLIATYMSGFLFDPSDAQTGNLL